MADRLELKPNPTILFTGDSITDAGRGERAYRPFGNGYVNFTANYLLAKYSQLNFRIINTGINGNTVSDLQRQWERDCLAHRPDVVSMLIGINDVWRLSGAGGDTQNGVRLYEQTYRRLLSQLRQRGGCQIVLMEPFMFCHNPQDVMFKRLSGYIDVVHTLAEEFDTVLVPLQAAINEMIKTVASDKWSDDMVHPCVWAHAWIAQRWIQATKV